MAGCLRSDPCFLDAVGRLGHHTKTVTKAFQVPNSFINCSSRNVLDLAGSCILDLEAEAIELTHIASTGEQRPAIDCFTNPYVD